MLLSRYRRLARNLVHALDRLGHDPLRTWNYALHLIDIRLRRITPRSFPPVIGFQASAHCDSTCRLCPVGLEIPGPPQGHLSPGLFRRIIDEARPYLTRIYFGDWGEPFLNPDVFDMIEYAERRGIVVFASTNLHRFRTPDDLARLLQCDLSFLTISLHGASQETFAAYQPGKTFDATIEKVRWLQAARRRRASGRPHLELRFAITRKNQHEVDAMRHLAAELGGTPSIHTASLNLRFHRDSADGMRGFIDEWAPTVTGCDDTGHGKSPARRLYAAVRELGSLDGAANEHPDLAARHSCRNPWRGLVVNWNGTVSLCCVDYGKFVMGDAGAESILSIWRNARYAEVRRLLRGERISGESVYPCATCVRY